MSPRVNRGLSSLTLILAVGLPALARADDSDLDGVDDAIDAFPCDAATSAAAFAPGDGLSGSMLFEDNWPSKGDLDFNDLAVGYNYVLRMNASGGVRRVTATFDMIALGGSINSGLALTLPVPRTAVQSITRKVGGNGSTALATSLNDTSTTIVLSNDMREFWNNATGVINAKNTLARRDGTRVVVEIYFNAPVTLTTVGAPYDLYIFRTSDPGHEIHRPQFSGSSAMNGNLFGTADDGSTPSRHFVDTNGLPFALVFPQLIDYPREAVLISTLYPGIVNFAASGGTSSQDFYVTPIVATAAYKDNANLGRFVPPPIPATFADQWCIDNADDLDLTVPTGCASAMSPEDVSNPTTVVGNGTPASCTEAALSTALAAGGVITFNCGPDPYTITLTSEHLFTSNTVIDGGNKITLSGGGTTRLFAIRTGNFYASTPIATLQRLTITGGYTQDTPYGGGALFRFGGSFHLVGITAHDNVATVVGQDVAGGVLHSTGNAADIITDSRFYRNNASNGGALGFLHASVKISNSVLTKNRATGNGGNPGNGGNGGAMYMDGVSQTSQLECVKISDNDGNASGGGLFRVSNNNVGYQSIVRSVISNNRIPNQSLSQGGGMYLQGFVAFVQETTLAKNSSRGAGGAFIGPHTNLNVRNVTFAENTALTGVGGAMMIDNNVYGSITNSTFVRNRAPGSTAFAGSIWNGTYAITVKNTIFADSFAGNGYTPVSCWGTMNDGGGNVQYPVARTGGGSDSPSALCTTGALVQDPQMGSLVDSGNGFEVAYPAMSSPAVGHGTGCPSTDALGTSRATDCTSGSIEVQ